MSNFVSESDMVQSVSGFEYYRLSECSNSVSGDTITLHKIQFISLM